MSHDSRRELEDIRSLVRSNSEILKPVFGMMFWQLSELEVAMNPEEFAKQGLSMQMEAEDDEVIAAFMSSFIKAWHSSQDFNAASRFMAECLQISADELLQCRQLWLDLRDAQATS